jgi:hypothetical protein
MKLSDAQLRVLLELAGNKYDCLYDWGDGGNLSLYNLETNDHAKQADRKTVEILMTDGLVEMINAPYILITDKGRRVAFEQRNENDTR